MSTHHLLGKRIVGVLWATMSSNNSRVRSHEGLILEDECGQRSVLRWTTIEETDGAYYGTKLVYPGSSYDPEREKVSA